MNHAGAIGSAQLGAGGTVKHRSKHLSRSLETSRVSPSRKIGFDCLLIFLRHSKKLIDEMQN